LQFGGRSSTNINDYLIRVAFNQKCPKSKYSTTNLEFYHTIEVLVWVEG